MMSGRVLAIVGAGLLAACVPVEVEQPVDEVTELEQRIAELEADNAGLDDRLAAHRDRFVDGAPRTLPPATAEGVEDALRAYLPDPDRPWLPGVTRWRESDIALPAELTDPAGGVASHGLLTLRLVDAVVDAEHFGGPSEAEMSFPWEVTSRVLRTADDEALATVQQWGGMGDDSAAGIDHLFTLRRGPGGWYVHEVAERNQCTRNERLPGEEGLPELCV